MDFTYLISLMTVAAYHQEADVRLPDDPFTQCATTMNLQLDMSRVVEETRLQTLQFVLKFMVVACCISLLGRCILK